MPSLPDTGRVRGPAAAGFKAATRARPTSPLASSPSPGRMRVSTT